MLSCPVITICELQYIHAFIVQIIEIISFKSMYKLCNSSCNIFIFMAIKCCGFSMELMNFQQFRFYIEMYRIQIHKVE